MKKIVLLTVALICSGHLLAFGQTGHRVTGEIAERYLTDNARKEIKKILGNESLPEISTYADEQRSNPSEFWQKTASPWHYMTIPDGKDYHDDMAPEEGDAITALRMYTKQLKDPKSSPEHKALALKFIVHVIGDLHQPLHVGNGTDRGGNDFKVEFFWDRSNLHRVWDTGMINNQNLSYTEWTNWLVTKISAEDVKAWHSVDPLVWAKESQEIRMRIYPATEKINYRYQYDHLPTLKLRLQQAGVRIAHYLNAIFQE